ncbi:MAG TPA: BON domain-containing protein [Vicinamibacterales bacterium]|nr:BON domain-containing protein [Vicinamibacterales bacterium]
MTTDRELQERVLNALEFEPGVDAAKIGVTAHDGVITLRGSVKTFYEKWTAERAAGHVYGVRALANDVEVLPNHDTRRSDTEIAEAAANALGWDTAVPAKAVLVTVRDGWVTLTGTVEWQYQRGAAEYTVRRLYGVKGLTNSIVVKPRVRVADVKARIEDAFKRSAEVDSQRVRVEARDGQVVLTGTVRSLSERREAERAAWSAPGVILVDDRLAVTP